MELLFFRRNIWEILSEKLPSLTPFSSTSVFSTLPPTPSPTSPWPRPPPPYPAGRLQVVLTQDEVHKVVKKWKWAKKRCKYCQSCIWSQVIVWSKLDFWKLKFFKWQHQNPCHNFPGHLIYISKISPISIMWKMPKTSAMSKMSRFHLTGQYKWLG